MEKSIFYEKLNKITGNVYTIEEEREVKNGIYEAELKHDNINQSTLNIYTGSKLTGTKITTYALSTPSLTPWKKIIKVFTNEPVIYISYETDGDTVEAEDINKVQEAIILTQEAVTSEEKRAIEAEKVLKKAIEAEEKRATEAENILTTNLNAEVERATKAENELTKNLKAEVERATSAETVLTNNLQAETERAIKAEEALTSNLEAEISRATETEQVLREDLNTEVERATKAENELTKNLQAEITRASNAEETLTKNLEAEISRATEAEQIVTKDLKTETERAKKAEQIVTEKLEAEINRANNAEVVLTENLQAEVQRASNAETILTNNLQTEVTRAKAAETTLTNHLQAEINRATSAETTLTDNLQAEVNRAKDAESELNKKLDTEEKRATTAEQQVTNNLQAEITRAKAEEQTIKQNLTAEESRAKTAEQTLTTNLTKEESRAKAAEAALEQKKVDKIAGKGLSTNDLTNELKKQYDETYQNATLYTNQKIADLIGGAPETLDTLKEVADAISEHKEVTDALNNAIGTKANQTELDSHTRNNTIHITSTERANWNDTNSKKHTHTNKTVLDGITEALITAWNSAVTHISDTVKHITSTERTNWNSAKTKADSAVQTIQINGSTQTKTNGVVNLPPYPSSITGNAETANKLKTAKKIGNASFDGSADISLSQIGAAATSHTHSNYVNQNAFSNVTVGSTTITADNTTDTLTLAAGSNVTLTADAAGDKVTISATDTNTTYGVATTNTLGLVKSGTDITVDANGNVSVVDDSHNHIISNVDGLQSALDAKAASSHTHSNYVNQNAFSNVAVGSTTIAADNVTDTLTLAAGSNVTITPDVTNDKITISATDTKFIHPTYPSKSNGLYKVTVDATGHISATSAVTKADITNLGIPAQDTNTTYGVATASTLGLVKSGTDITVDSSGNVSVVDDSHNHIISNVDGLQSALDAKAASSHTHSNYVNQNAFSNITVGSTTIVADNTTDTLTLVAGSNVTLTPDVANDKVTISATNTVYPFYNKYINRDFMTQYRTQTKGNTAAGNYISNIRCNEIVNFAPQHGSGLAWGSGDTHGYLYTSYSSAVAYIAGGNADKLNWIKKIILEGDTVYIHPTESGNKHIPAGGSSGQILKWSADGTASWQVDNSLKKGGLTWDDLKGV